MDDRARDNLRYIRETMERAGAFTAVPGWGGVAMGITAIGAAAIAYHQHTFWAWLATWTVEAAIAIVIAAWSTYSKMRRSGAPKNSAASTAILNRSKCCSHGSSIFTFPIGDPMLITPIPLSDSLLRISAHSAESKSITFLLFTPRSSKCVIPFSLHV